MSARYLISRVLEGENPASLVSSLVEAEVKGIIRKAPDLPGTRWRLPYTLFKDGFLGWEVVGRYGTEKHARKAAERRGIKIVKESIEETKKPPHKGVWFHASEKPLQGKLKPLYLAPASLAIFHGDVVSKFKISPRAKWFDMAELRDDMIHLFSDMDSIGYNEKEIAKLQKLGFDAIWDSEDYNRGYDQVFILNPDVLQRVDVKEHFSGGEPVPKPPALKQRFAEVGLAKDKKGFFVYTHRARSPSYPSPEKIPLDKVKYIASTG